MITVDESSNLPALIAAGESIEIPDGMSFSLTETIPLGGTNSADPFNDQIIYCRGRAVLNGASGLDVIQAYGRGHETHGLVLNANGARCLVLGDNANDYLGNEFLARRMRLFNGTVGLFNGKFDASSFQGIIKRCGIGAHVTGNQDAMQIQATINDCELALWVNGGGRASTRGGVWANNRQAAKVGSDASGDSGSLIMETPHFEALRGDCPYDAAPQDYVSAPAGSAYLVAYSNSRIDLNFPHFVNSSTWFAAKGGAGCRLYFRGGNPAKARQNGSCLVTADDDLRLPVDYNGVVTYIARPWPVEFV